MASLKYYAIQGTEDNSTSGPTGVIGTAGSVGAITSSGGTLTTPLVAMRPYSSKKNINFRVITYDVESAIRLVKERHPNILITSISLKDKIDCIDPAVVLEIFDKRRKEMKVNNYSIYGVSYEVSQWGSSYGVRRTVEVLSTSNERAEELISSRYKRPIKFMSCHKKYEVDLVDSILSFEVFSERKAVYISAHVSLYWFAFDENGGVLDLLTQRLKVVYNSKSDILSVLNETYPRVGRGVVEVYNDKLNRKELESVEYKLELNSVIDLIDPNISLEIFNQ